MNRYKDKLIQDKTLPKHHYITLELVRRKFISSESDFDLYLYDALFEELLLRYEFNVNVNLFFRFSVKKFVGFW